MQTPPPIWVVGTPRLQGDLQVAERNLRRVARLGDGWMITAWPLAIEEYTVPDPEPGGRLLKDHPGERLRS